MSTATTYQIVTDRIIELLQRGVVPWRAPWSGGVPLRFDNANAISQKPYRGINALLAFAVRRMCGYSSNLWISYKQAHAYRRIMHTENAEASRGN